MTCGMGNIGAASIGTLAKDLRRKMMSEDPEWKINRDSYTVGEIVDKARKFLFEERFREIVPPPPAPHSLEFWIGGYSSNFDAGHEVWKISIVNGECPDPQLMQPPGSTGLFVGGQPTPVNRLVGGFDQGLYDLLLEAGLDTYRATQLQDFLRQRLEAPIVMPTMPVRDAIDLADFLVETTKRFFRFLPGADIVGGDTDIAVVTKFEGSSSFACEICRVTGAAQEPLHFARPLLFLDLDERLQLAHVMGVAQGVQHARHGVIGLPVIVDDDAGDIRQKAAALGADVIEGQQRRAGDMQPSRLAADPKAGLVHVLDRRRGDVIPHHICEALKAPGKVPADPGDGRGRQRHPEEIGHQLDQTLLGQQLVVQEIEYKRTDPRAVLHGRVDAFRKRRPRLRAAIGAAAIVRTMLGDDEGPRVGQIEHLPGAVADARVLIQARAAPGAGRRVMIDHDIGFSDLPQGLAFVALLPARFLAGPVPQAPRPRRLRQPIARRRLAAIRAVQPEPALELRQPRLQRRILGLKGRDQREQVFQRRRTRRFASYPMLESEPASAVERIFSSNPAAA